MVTAARSGKASDLHEIFQSQSVWLLMLDLRGSSSLQAKDEKIWGGGCHLLHQTNLLNCPQSVHHQPLNLFRLRNTADCQPYRSFFSNLQVDLWSPSFGELSPLNILRIRNNNDDETKMWLVYELHLPKPANTCLISDLSSPFIVSRILPQVVIS